MKKFVATLNDMSYINTGADHMEVKENMLWVWNGDQLVAMVETSAIISAHINEKGNGNESG